MNASSVQRTESEERWWKGCSRTCSMLFSRISSYRRMEQLPDCEAPTTAHCGCVWSQARPRIGWLSTSRACVCSSVSRSATATTPSFLPISTVLGRIGWNSNWRTPLLQCSSRVSCGTGPASFVSFMWPVVPYRHLLAACTAAGGGGTAGVASRSKSTALHRPFSGETCRSVMSQPDLGATWPPRRCTRSPCVHLRSSKSRLRGSTDSIIVSAPAPAAAVGVCKLAGRTGLGGQKPMDGAFAESSRQSSPRVSSSAGLCRPTWTHREADFGAPGPWSDSTQSSTSQPFPRPQGCGPTDFSASSSTLSLSGDATEASCWCGGSGQRQAPPGSRPIGHSAMALAGVGPTQNLALLIGKPGRPATRSRKRMGTRSPLPSSTSTCRSAWWRTEGDWKPCCTSQDLCSDAPGSSGDRSVGSSASAGSRSSSPRKRTTA
mmetsp:Transcript_60142/g.154836  ORF Transcript_60142/g.154836 Transcript_60142/m.154836 type:complete len:433 (-) Transcript_60142:190-1488(-)